MLNFHEKQILVIGDSFLDEYIFGNVSRISQEAPVPIVEVNLEKTKYSLGGAANTAANILSLGGETRLVTLMNPADEAGRSFDKKCSEIGLQAYTIRHDKMTTRKVRVISQGQQMLRVDYEDKSPLVFTPHDMAELLKDLVEVIGVADMVVVSDYAKGFLDAFLLTTIIKECNKQGKPVIVDPKPVHGAFYKGCSYITPNTKEMLELVPGSTDPILAAAEYSVFNRCGVLLTRGAEGIALITGGDYRGTWSAQAREVFDVSGAGDTVVAAFALALVCGAEEEEAIIFANKAAGVVVGKHGTATVTMEEINEAK